MALSYLVKDHGGGGTTGEEELMLDEPFDVVQANLSMNSNQSNNSGERDGDAGDDDAYYHEDEYDTRQQHRSSRRSSSSSSNDRHKKSAQVHRRHRRSRTPTNEVGDLPALTKTTSKSTPTKKDRNSGNGNIGVTGGRSASLRPLSPPSRAGLDDPATFGTSGGRNKGGSGGADDQYYDENTSRGGTIDETMSTGHDSYTRSRMSTLDGDDYYDDDDADDEDGTMIPIDELRQDKSTEEVAQQGAALCAFPGDDPAMALFDCDTTLTAMGELCGLPPPSDRQKRSDAVVAAAKRKALALGEKHSLSRAGGVEEQTAIEVEYVEPAYRGRDGEDAMYNSKRKNELLKAMAKKAKSDYEQNRPNSATNSAGGTTISSNDVDADDDGDDDAPQENVYATFTASEKRKFLKLINGGMTPYHATDQVIADREAAEQERESGTTSGDDKSNQNASSSSKRRMNLAFWKRKSGKDKTKQQTRAAIPVSPDGSTPSSIENTDEENAGFAVSGIKYYDAVRRNRSDDEDDDENDDDDDDDNDHFASTKKNQSADSKSGMKFPKLGFSKLSKDNVVVDSDDENQLNPTVQPHTYVSDDENTATDVEEELVRIIAASPPSQRGANDATASQANGVLRPLPVKSDVPVSATREIRQVISEDSLLDDLMSQAADEAEEKKMEDKMEEAMAAKLLGVSSAAAAATSTTATALSIASPKEEELERYLTARNSNSQNGNRSFDQMSVVSGKSHKTSMTLGTNYTTQSTRSRRPGQAKVRMEREKKSHSLRGERTTGWQESIQAVAAKTGRVWDPEHGWRDYFDPRNRSIQSEDDLGVDVDIHSIHEESIACSDKGSRAPVGVSHNSDLTQQPQQAVFLCSSGEDGRSHASRTPSRKSRKSVSSVASITRSTKPRGWVETMKAATANLATDERKWDPEQGWIGVDPNEIINTTVEAEEDEACMKEVAITAESNAQDFEAEEDEAYMREVAITAESDTQDFGTIQALPATEAAIAISSPSRYENDVQSVTRLEAIADNHDSGVQFVADEEENAVDEESTAISAVSGRYIQIGDTGSVQSHYRRTAKNMRANQPPPSQLLQQDVIPEYPGSTQEIEAAAEGSAHTHQSALTNVKKERVGNEDAGLFPSDKWGGSGSDPVDLDKSTHSNDGSVDLIDHQKETIHRAFLMPPSHDRNDSFDGGDSGFGAAPADFSWDADEDNDKVDVTRKPVPKLKIKIRDSSALPPPSPYNNRSMDRPTGPLSEASFGSRGSTTSSIPKLAAPKRDTSPIRANKRADPPATEYNSKNRLFLSESATTTSTVQIGSRGRAKPPSPQESRLDPVATNDDEVLGEISNDFCSEMIDHTSMASQNDEKPKVFRQPRVPTPPNEKSTVKDLHNFWEARSASFDSKPSPSEVLQSSEWKSYLVKKVQSGSSVARRNKDQSHSPMDPEEHDSNFDRPSTPTRNFRTSQDSDASGQPRVGAFEDISDLSPIRNEESDSEYVPSETSTSIAQGTTFLQRLQACAAPMVNKTTASCGPGVPMAAHLAFLRNNPTVGGMTKQNKNVGPAPLCGRPDVIVEEGTVDEDDNEEQTEKLNGEQESRNSRKLKHPRSKGKAGSDVSSVISDEQFGAKTAYLEAIAMKAAVSGGSKKKKRSGSEVSSESDGGAKHSAQFQKFLDRRSASKDTASEVSNGQNSSGSGKRLPPKKPPTGREDSVAARADRYATKRMEQMMGRSPEEEMGAFPTIHSGKNSSASRIAAEELAAARVEAMMQTLPPRNIEDEEGEI